MDDELVSIVLPIFRDASIDDEDRTEQAWELLKENSPRKGQALEDQRSRVFLMCREIVEGEIAAAAEERRRQALATGPSSRDPTSDPRNVPGASTQPPSSGQWASSIFNPTVGEFIPGRPLPTTRAEKRAAYEHRMQGLRQSMAEKDYQIAELQGQITWHNQEIQKWENAQDGPLDEYLAMLQASTEPPMSTEEGRRRLSEAQAADDILKQLKEAKDRLMQEKRKTQEDLEELHEDMMPREGELGPEQ
ncbi:MAG: hypothetical protein LQ343_004652 [Gyalolechia ehrenbergii]|nr:MAG: hypothetical protein LQ343_004652 [Gyalolechia ehrenbergii]